VEGGYCIVDARMSINEISATIDSFLLGDGVLFERAHEVPS